MARNFFIGGNWKMNGSVTLAKSLVDMLNNATIPAGTGMSYRFLYFVIVYAIHIC